MKYQFTKLAIVTSLCVAVALTAVASVSCSVKATLPCYGQQTSCSVAGKKGTPSGGGSLPLCGTGCPGGTACTYAAAASTCTYTCTVGKTPHKSTVTYHAVTGTSGTCPAAGVS